MIFGHSLDLNKCPHSGLLAGPLATPNARGRFQHIPSIDEHLPAVVPMSSLRLLSISDGERGHFQLHNLTFAMWRSITAASPRIQVCRRMPCELKCHDVLLSHNQLKAQQKNCNIRWNIVKNELYFILSWTIQLDPHEVEPKYFDSSISLSPSAENVASIWFSMLSLFLLLINNYFK